MILAVDVSYCRQTAVAAGVAFKKWDEARPRAIFTSTISAFGAYIPGEFHRRELGCILGLLTEHRIRPACIIVDGYVYLDGVSKAGMGKYLYDILEGKVMVIGVAKKPFKDISESTPRPHWAGGLIFDDVSHTSVLLLSLLPKRCIQQGRIPSLLQCNLQGLLPALSLQPFPHLR